MPAAGPGPSPAAGVGSAVDADTSAVLATVGDTEIRHSWFLEFYEDVPEALHSGQPGLDGFQNHLQTLVDMELLRREALERGIDTSPAFVAKVGKAERDGLRSAYLRDQIDLTVTPEDVDAFFEAHDLGRLVRLGQIVTASLDSARTAFAEIQAGTTFASAAHRWSLDAESASKGGDTGRYVSRLDIAPRLSDELFELSPGQLSGPIDMGGRYGLFQVLDESQGEPTSLDIHKAVFMAKSRHERALLLDRLRGELSLEMSTEGLQAFHGELQLPEPSVEALAQIVLFTHDDGQVSALDAYEAIQPRQRPSLAYLPPDGLIERMKADVLPDVLFLSAARRDGYDRRPELVGTIAKLRRQQLIIQLRVAILEERVEITDDEVRSEYEENPDRYTRPERITVQEILVGTEAQANLLRERIEAGESMADLVRAHSLRSPEQRDEDGHMTVTLADGRVYGRLASAAWKATDTQLHGAGPRARWLLRLPRRLPHQGAGDLRRVAAPSPGDSQLEEEAAGLRALRGGAAREVRTHRQRAGG